MTQTFYYSNFYSFAETGLSPATLQEKALTWADRYPVVAYFDPNDGGYNYGGFDHLLGVSGNAGNLVQPADAFASLQEQWPAQEDLLFGFLSYDLKNQSEKLHSQNPDYVGFPLMYFFRPEVYLQWEESGFWIFSRQDNCQQIYNAIVEVKVLINTENHKVTLTSRISKDEYLQAVAGIRNEIRNGEIYEMNFCQEFYAEQVTIAPLAVFKALTRRSPMPFSGYFKLEEKYLLCASPERFIRKCGNKLISQPIKGTIRRGQSPQEDEALRLKLQQDEKEIAENMMIMDLVRNDLNRSCRTGTVRVEEMFQIYSFRQVHQMITTVTGELRPDCHPVQALNHAFPMGSMTGAPKIRAMELIDQYESFRRGLFSGSIGYLKPNGDFDFNVVIRSLQYNAATGYLSTMVGSAITYDSQPEQEYQECLLKARAIMEVLNNPAELV